MGRWTVLLMTFALLLSPSLGSANPNGVGGGNQDMQCGGACHGDADQNRSSAATVTVVGDTVAYQGLLTSVSVTIEGVETSASGTLGVFLLSSLAGANDLPSDHGWVVLSNSEGEDGNYVERNVPSGTTEQTVTWTLRAPLDTGTYTLHGAIHHGSTNGDQAPYYGQSTTPLTISVVEPPEDLPRLAEDYRPPTSRLLGEDSPLSFQTAFVTEATVEYRLQGGSPVTVQAVSSGEDTWTFDLPVALQHSVVEWRVTLVGEGPDQVTPWFQVRQEAPGWSVDENAAYAQSLALFLTMLAGFLALQHRSARTVQAKHDAFNQLVQGGEE